MDYIVTSSYAFLAFLALHAVASVKIESQQAKYLLDIKSALLPTSSKVLATWNPSNDCSKWLGVTCEIEDVVGLFLSTNKVPTVYGSPYLPNLPAGTSFKGDILSSVAKLKYLKVLVLSGLSLTGKIPKGLGSLPLSHLVLSNNKLNGAIPAQFSSLSPYLLDLHSNEFSGDISPIFSKGYSYVIIDLSKNKFSTAIPASISSANGVKILNLGGNSFRGTVPASISQLSNLRELYLNNNKLGGLFPAGLKSAALLSVLDLHANRFNGSLPAIPFFSALTFLSTLDLSYNRFSGRLPLDIGSSSKLVTFNLTLNRFTGGLFTSFQSSGLKYVNYANNYFTGPSIIKNNGQVFCPKKVGNSIGVDIRKNCLTVQPKQACGGKQRAKC